MKAQDLFKAWNEGVERATGKVKHADESEQENLYAVAGFSLQSGLKAGVCGYGSYGAETASAGIKSPVAFGTIGVQSYSL